MKYLIGNWKSNKTFEETYTWFDDFAKLYKHLPETKVVVAVPFVFIQEAHKKIHELNLEGVHVAAQDVSPFPFGSYTGAISAQMLKNYADFCIVGHSERRDHFAESHLEIANKVDQLIQSNITPVLCVDEPYAQKQLAGIPVEYYEKLIIAYEPLSAIGTGEPDKPEHTKEVVDKIHAMSGEADVPIIYGGSTNPENASTYMKIDGVSGLLPGGSSLVPAKFAGMLPAFM